MDRATIIKLRKLLSELYTTVPAIQQVAYDAGLELTRIDWSGNVTNIWHKVLEEAQKVRKVDQLILCAIDEFEERKDDLAPFLTAANGSLDR